MRLGNILFFTIVFSSLLFGGLFLLNGRLRAEDGSPAPSPSAGDVVQLKQFACDANSADALQKCILDVRQNGTPVIKITSPINCTTREACQFDLSNLPKGVLLQGTTGESKITRSNDYSYTLFNATNSNSIHLVDLIIVDADVNPCPEGADCPVAFNVANVSGISFQHVTFQNTHGPSIKISDSSNISITGSTFLNSHKSALEILAGATSTKVIVENNRFQNNGGVGLAFQANSSGSDWSIIRGNRFIDNQEKGAFNTSSLTTCVYPCIGTQLKLLGSTNNLTVEKNIVNNGLSSIFETAGLYTSGIELPNKDVSNISLSCNEISNNRGAGIVQGQAAGNISGITIGNNKIWNNGMNMNLSVAKVEDNNCFDESCKIAACL